ncbi:MAG: TerB family tellurite resistance protein [Proteobacteria bacterium]|nr:TerB family tellurite resistance protein [Pseudomonadota bacterium]
MLKSLEGAILEDGIIDADEVQMIRDVIFGSGGGGGEGVDKAEAEFLFRLNDAVTGKENSPLWGELFVEAIGKFVLEDEESPGEIDAGEAAYLIEKIMADGQVDDVELALLVHIKNNAKAIHEDLKTKMDELGI